MMGWRFRKKMVGSGERIALADYPDGSQVIVTGNAAVQTVELGVFTGTKLEVLRNDPADRLLAIQAGDTRLTLPRELAENIFVEPATPGDAPCGNGQPRHLLRRIRAYLDENGTVDTRSLALHFSVDEEAMEAMLAFLAARGQIQKQVAGCAAHCAGCKGCGQASQAPVTVFWSTVPGAGGRRA